jgi:hypothetical protein
LTDAITRISRADGCDSSHARAAATRSLARAEITISREAGIGAARLDAAPHLYRPLRRSRLARGDVALFPQHDNGCRNEGYIRLLNVKPTVGSTPPRAGVTSFDFAQDKLCTQ